MSSSLLSTVPPTKSARIAVSVYLGDAVIVPPVTFAVDEAGVRIPPASLRSTAGTRIAPCFPRRPPIHDRNAMTASQADPALQALMLPFADGTLAWPREGALFLRARD